jgi:hypothetical protein
MKQTIKSPNPAKLRLYFRHAIFFCLFLSLLAVTLYILINSPA